MNKNQIMRQAMITFLFFSLLISLRAHSETLAKHICPFSDQSNDTSEVLSTSSLIKTSLCFSDEIKEDTVQDILKGDVVSTLIETDNKKELKFIMVAYFEEGKEKISNVLYKLENLDKLLRSTNDLTLLAYTQDQFQKNYPAFYDEHPDMELNNENNQIFLGHAKFGSGLFSVKDEIVKHVMKKEERDVIHLYYTLISSRKVFGSSYQHIKLMDYQGGTLMVSFTNDIIKHSQASMYMDKIRKAAVQSAWDFVYDIKELVKLN